MGMIRSIKSLVMGATLLLSACTGGNETSTSTAGLFSLLVTSFQEKGSTTSKKKPLTREFIDKLPVSAMEIVLESRNITALISPYASRSDGSSGTIDTWRNAANSQIVLDNGVLIATRGAGNDLGSALVTSVVKSVKKRKAFSGPHVLYVSGFDNRSTQIKLECKMEVLGQTRIEIVGHSHNVVHLQEGCISPIGSVTNDYWVDSVDSTVWQSRQWAGPSLGYLKLRVLKK